MKHDGRFEGYTDPVAREDFFRRTLAIQAKARARYADRNQLINGKVWRFADDEPGIWRLCWNDTELKKEAESGPESSK
jgi:hypothetical protein